MQIIVMSDTHRDFHSIQEVVTKHRNADIFIHLGDGARELGKIMELYPEYKFLSVRGNCDFVATANLAGCIHCGMAKIFYTHGHMYNVKYNLETLLNAAKEIQANVVLFGHTHIPMVDYKDGLHILNPGSLGMPRAGNNSTYGVVEADEQGIVCRIQELRPC
jgi:putative phosphoesterase